MIMLVLFTFGGLAQKSTNAPGALFQKSERKHLQAERKQSFVAEKEMYRRHTGDEEQIRRMKYGIPGKLKSALALPVEQMDSLIDFAYDTLSMSWNLRYKNWFEYDSLGRNTKDTWLGAEESDTTYPDYGGSWEAVWDANDRIVEDFSYSWNDSTGFVKRSWYQIFYDGNGNQIAGYSSEWNDGTQSWYPNYTDTTTFDGMDNRLERIDYNYDTMIMIWDPSSRTTWQYDSVGNRKFRQDYYWNTDSSDWDGNNRTEYFYDQNGRDTAEIDSYWDGFSWYPSWKEVNKYNANGARTFQGYYNWDGELLEWYGSYKNEYTLDANDRVTEELQSEWDNTKSEWYIDRKYTYMRDGTGNITEETAYNYDTTQMVYFPEWKDVYEYNLGVSWNDIALPYEFTEDEDDDDYIWTIYNKLLKYYYLEYDTTEMSWDTTNYENFYYSPFGGGTVQPVECDAGFRTTPGQGALDIIFTDASGADVSSWYWTFGDGSTSTMQHPMHTYAFAGTYKVSLSTTDQTGECSNTMVEQIVVGSTLCNARFTMSVDTAGMKIFLTDFSQGTNLNYFWSLGDGEVSTLAGHEHTYQFAGTYEVTLTVENNDGSCMDRYSLRTRVGTAVCEAGFDVFVDSSTSTARFTAKNQNPANIYRWEFGDGSVEKFPNVTKTFTHPGYYSARLTVSNSTAACVNSQKATILIGRPSPGGQANFIYVSGDANKVQFNDRSQGEGLSYFWDFNDGNSSNVQNPSNVYVLPGYYDVCLTVSTADGKRNTYCEKIFAGTETTNECLAQFEYQLSDNQLGISCVDRSLGSPDNWLWTYNDGWTSTTQNTNWSTSTPAYVKIQQTIINSTNGCRDDVFALVNMGAEGKLVAGIGYIVDTSNKKADTYPVDFVGVSLGDAGKLKWTFGDGTADSTSINPVHVYTQPGTYEVCLTVTNTNTGEEDTSCESVTVGEGAPSSSRALGSLEMGLKSYPNPFKVNTTVEFYLLNDSEIDLSIYDLMGRKVQTVMRDHRFAGLHTFEFEGSELEAGNYYLILRTDNGVERSVLSVVK